MNKGMNKGVENSGSPMLVMMLLFSLPLAADTNVVIRGLMKDSAVVEIDGTQRILKVGKASPEGVRLISANSKEAVLEIEGVSKRMTLSKNRSIKPTQAAPPAQLRMLRRSNGHYYTSGIVNNRPVDFMVDTGASLVSISSSEAERLGIDFRQGKMVNMETASGRDRAYKITLKKLSIGSIIVENVDFIVIPGQFPSVALLGNSFLQKVNMRIEDGVMILQTKY